MYDQIQSDRLKRARSHMNSRNTDHNGVVGLPEKKIITKQDVVAHGLTCEKVKQTAVEKKSKKTSRPNS